MKHFVRTKSLSEWLTYDTASLVNHYQKKAQQLMRLNQLWCQHIESNLVANSRIANFHIHQLYIEVDSTAWATRLQYWIPELLPQLRTWPMLEQITHIKWYIKPPNIDHLNPPIQRRIITPLSEINKQGLHTIANTVTHAGLKAALNSLANNT